MLLKTVYFCFLLLSFFHSHAQLDKSVFYMHQSHIYFDQDRFREAEQYADSALMLAIQSGIPDSLANAYRWRSAIHLAKKDYRRALEDFQSAFVYADSVAALTLIEAEKRWDEKSRLDAEAQQKEIDKMKEDLAALKNLNRLDRTINYTIVFAVGILVIVILVFVYRRNVNLNLLLQQSRNDLTDVRSFREKVNSVLAGDLKKSVADLESTLLEKNAWDDGKRMRLRSSLQTINRLMDHIIEWVGYQANLKPVFRSEFDCKLLAEESIKKFQDLLNEKKLSIDLFIPAGQKAFADREMVALVLENLLSNAVKYSQPGGKITFFSGSKDDLITIGIKDSGVGIGAEELKEIFEMHKDSRPSGDQGSGIGLIFSRDLVERNGGRFYAESRPGEGSTFTFTLPGKKNA